MRKDIDLISILIIELSFLNCKDYFMFILPKNQTRAFLREHKQEILAKLKEEYLKIGCELNGKEAEILAEQEYAIRYQVYGEKVKTVKQKFNVGWTNQGRATYEDHKKNRFQTLSQMCNYWGKTVSYFKAKRAEGWNLKSILENKAS